MKEVIILDNFGIKVATFTLQPKNEVLKRINNLDANSDYFLNKKENILLSEKELTSLCNTFRNFGFTIETKINIDFLIESINKANSINELERIVYKIPKQDNARCKLYRMLDDCFWYVNIETLQQHKDFLLKILNFEKNFQKV